jgi:hypothetical protein
MMTLLGCSYQGNTHQDSNTSDIDWKVANKIRELELHQFKPRWDGNEIMKQTVNILPLGEKHLNRQHWQHSIKRCRGCMMGLSMLKWN